MFALSTLNSKLFPVWKTCIVTITVASYGLLRYVIPFEGHLDGAYYFILFSVRIFLIMCVHHMYCVWVYAFLILRKWTLNDFGALFYLVVFTLLTLDFISNGIYKVFFKSAYAAVINLDRLRVERTMIDLVIAHVMMKIIPSRLAKIEFIEHKVIHLSVLDEIFNIYY